MPLGPSVLAALFLRDFPRNPRKFGYSGSTERSATDESKVMKERGDIELSIAILGRHLTVYK